MKVLVNDGLEEVGIKMMEDAGITVDTTHIPQEKLMDVLPAYDGICVRSNTKVRQALIDVCPNLKAIGRGGVGLDNIDTDYARSKGIQVINTPEASSRSVAELVFGHALSLSRFLHMAHKEMPVSGYESFSTLKKSYAKGLEMTGKTLGILGLGRIGQELASIALGFGMKVVVFDPFVAEATIHVGNPKLKCTYILKSETYEKLLLNSDYISLHIPALSEPILNERAFEMMKKGVIILNASRGASIDELALLKALDSGKVAMAGLDVFMNEPTPKREILEHPRVSSSPHIGGSTIEAQNKIGIELANKMIAALTK
ncbi:MAG: D-2-hydroxyacid dehydrogenase [Saprospiraceae bacterium]